MKPYTGDGDYIFISYSHKDKEQVYPVIDHFIEKGYHIWYDEGIDPGTEWDENIANHLKGCIGIFAFLSENYLNSENCKDELNYARDLGKERVLIYLEPVELPAGMAMRLNRIQAIHKYKYNDQGDFFTELTKAPMFEKYDVSSHEYHEDVITEDNTDILPENKDAKNDGVTDDGIITKKDFIKKEEYRAAGYCIFGAAISIYVFAVVMMFLGDIVGSIIIVAFTLLAQIKLNQWYALVAAAVALGFGFILPFFFIPLLAVTFLILCLLEVDRLYKQYLTSGQLLPFNPFKGLFAKKTANGQK